MYPNVSGLQLCNTVNAGTSTRTVNPILDSSPTEEVECALSSLFLQDYGKNCKFLVQIGTRSFKRNIRFQSGSISRRKIRPGLAKRAKRVAAGRPSSMESKQRHKKRKRNLSLNVRANRPRQCTLILLFSFVFFFFFCILRKIYLCFASISCRIEINGNEE